jgi:uncharacterized protein
MPEPDESHTFRRNLLIPVESGVTLAADLYLPKGNAPAPTLVSLNPYRKDDIAGAFSVSWGSYLAESGYAQLIVDTRGTGASSGTPNENFARQEAVDGATVVEWAAAQPWSNGSVGIWGMSYGGAMALAVAAQRPPHLSAMATVYGYADYYQDVAFPGGCLGCLGRFARENWMLALALAPPTLQDTKGRWREVWDERLEGLKRRGLSSARWHEHRDHDDYWAERTVDVSAISAPTFVLGAWRDLFPEAMMRVFGQLTSPKRLLMGPWLHVSPDDSPVEPIDWLGELVKWWDLWLAGPTPDDTKPSSDRFSQVMLYVQGSGRWRSEQDWPIAGLSDQVTYLGEGDLGPDIGEKGEDEYVADPRVGVRAGLWDPLGTGNGYPLEQSPDIYASLIYTSQAVTDETEIIGSPTACLYISQTEGDEVNLVAKLVDIAPDGRRYLITTGWSHDGPSSAPARSGIRELEVRLWATAYSLQPGHRYGLAVSCSDFPRIWPTPSNPTIRLHRGGETPSRLVLPLVPAAPAESTTPPRPDPSRVTAPWDLTSAAHWYLGEDLGRHEVAVTLGGDQQLRLPQGATFDVKHMTVATVARDCPAGARVKATAHISLPLTDGSQVEVEATSLFHFDHSLVRGEVLIDSIPRFTYTWTQP